MKDSIVEEVRKIRRDTEAECEHDWKKLFAHYRQVESRSKPLVAGKPKRLDRTRPVRR